MNPEADHRREGIDRSRILFIWGIGLGVLLLALNAYAPVEPSALQRLLGSAIMALGTIPALLWALDPKGIPFLGFYGIAHAIYYGSSIFLRSEFTRAHYSPVHIAPEWIDKALLYSFLGLACLYLGYYLLGDRLLRRWPRPIRLEWTGVDGPVAGAVFGAIGLVVYLSDTVEALPVSIRQITSLIGGLGILGAVILLVSWKRGELSLPGVLFLWGVLIPIRLIAGFATGLNFQAAEMLLALGFAAAALSRRVPWKIATVVLVLLVMLEPAKVEFREQNRLLRDPGTTTVAAERYVDAAIQVWARDDILDETTDVAASRFGVGFVLAQVIEATPERVPYWGGETYETLITKFIPRFLLPTKPTEEIGQTFGHRYGFLERVDEVTSFNLPQMIEFYANFGPVGLLLGMTLLGLLFRTIIRFIGGEKGEVGAIIIGSYVLVPLAVIETALPGSLGETGFRLGISLILAWGLGVLKPERRRVVAPAGA